MNNTYELEILPLAKKDMDDIVDYIANTLYNKTATIDLIYRFNDALDNITTFPYGTAQYNLKEKHKNEYRCFKIKNYHMFYTINEQSQIITIVRVLYSKMHFDNILK